MAEQPGGSVNLTPFRALVVAALFGGLAGWLLVVTANAFDLIPPEVPWTAPIGLILLAALVGALAYSTHQRIQVRRERMEPSRAVAFLVLGKASALAGALVAGGYFGVRLDVPHPDRRGGAAGPGDPVRQSPSWRGIALCIAGLALERACKIPGEDDDDDRLEPDTPR